MKERLAGVKNQQEKENNGKSIANRIAKNAYNLKANNFAFLNESEKNKLTISDDTDSSSIRSEYRYEPFSGSKLASKISQLSPEQASHNNNKHSLVRQSISFENDDEFDYDKHIKPIE